MAKFPIILIKILKTFMMIAGVIALLGCMRKFPMGFNISTWLAE
jgi:hypothetical protein